MPKLLNTTRSRKRTGGKRLLKYVNTMSIIYCSRFSQRNVFLNWNSVHAQIKNGNGKIRVIDTCNETLKLLCYSFASVPVTHLHFITLPFSTFTFTILKLRYDISASVLEPSIDWSRHRITFPQCAYPGAACQATPWITTGNCLMYTYAVKAENVQNNIANA